MLKYTPFIDLKLSDWLKESHMTWIIFDNVHVWKLIHVCYFLLYFPDSQRSCHSCQIWSLLSRFYSWVQTKKSMNGVL